MKMPWAVKQKTYYAWKRMLSRCENIKSNSYKYYGAKGITVCERWHSFENFVLDMGIVPDGLSLDRINSRGNYEPSNCRWADQKTQNRNRSNITLHDFNGEKLTCTEVARMLGLHAENLKQRMNNHGISLQLAAREIIARKKRRIK